MNISNSTGRQRLSRVVSLAFASAVIAVAPTLAVASELSPIAHSLRHPEAVSIKAPAAPPNENIVFAVSIQPRDLAGLEAFAKAVNDPRSLSYRQFLTPTQIAQRFGPAQSDVDEAVAYLKSEGLTIIDVAKNNFVITAKGTASQVSSAFNTHLIHATRKDGTTFRTNTTSLYFPSDLAGKIVSIDGIDTSIRHIHRGHFSAPKPAKVALQDATTTTLTPALYRGCYGSATGYAAGFYGEGVNIAIANWDGYRLANIPLWVAANNLPVPAGGAGSNITVVKVGDGTTTYGAGTPQGEGDLDLQAVMMAAPLANIYDYDDATDDNAAPITTFSQISSDNIADIVTESYGWESSDVESDGTTYYGSTWTSAHDLHVSLSAQGITYLAASGDTGTSNTPATGMRFGYPDIDPNVLIVGGTIPTVDAVTGARESETNWGLAGGYAGTGGNDPYDTPANGFAFNVAPSYQTSYIPSLTSAYAGRLFPDVAAFAAGQNGLGEESSPYANWALVIYFEDLPNYGLGTRILVDGTSIASPATAGSLGAFMGQIYSGVTPLANRSNVRLGQFQPTLYPLAANPSTYSNALYDIQTGITAGNLPGTSTPVVPTPGYDMASGWGALNYAGLLTVTTLGTHLAVVYPDTVVAGSGNVTAKITGTGFSAGETVTFNGTALATTFVNSTQVQAVIPASFLTVSGTDTIAVSNLLGPTTDTRPFYVTNPVPSGLSLSPNSATAGSGAFSLMVTGTGFVPGATVKWGGVSLPTTYVSSTEVTANVGAQYITIPGSTYSITVTNPVPGGGTSAAATFTTPGTFHLSVLYPNTVAAGGSQFTLTVTGEEFESGATVYFGGVALTTTFVNSQELTAVVPAPLITAAKDTLVEVKNADSTVSNTRHFYTTP